MKELEQLNAAQNAIRDVTPLYGLKKLRELFITGNELSKGQIMELISVLPDCRITN